MTSDRPNTATKTAEVLPARHDRATRLKVKPKGSILDQAAARGSTTRVEDILASNGVGPDEQRWEAEGAAVFVKTTDRR